MGPVPNGPHVPVSHGLSAWLDTYGMDDTTSRLPAPAEGTAGGRHICDPNNKANDSHQTRSPSQAVLCGASLRAHILLGGGLIRSPPSPHQHSGD